jgi:hypothetical protein
VTGAGTKRLGGSLAPLACLVAVAVLLAPVRPFPLLAVPFALFLVAFRPRDLFGLATAAVLLALVFWPGPLDADSGWFMQRGWCLLAGGLFVASTVLRRPRGLFDRGLGSVTVATAAITLAAISRPAMGRALDGWMEAQIREAATTAYAILAADTKSASGSIGESIRSAIETWAVFQHDVYPALLALATMAALAACWYFAGRNGEDYETPPAVRDFGFRDELVWVLVAGLMLLVLPLGGGAFRAGENATVFMVALYLARGGAILAWIAAVAATSAWSWVFLAVGAVLAYPFVFGAALVIGIGDTWLHLRERLATRMVDRPGR